MTESGQFALATQGRSPKLPIGRISNHVATYPLPEVPVTTFSVAFRTEASILWGFLRLGKSSNHFVSPRYRSTWSAPASARTRAVPGSEQLSSNIPGRSPGPGRSVRT
jgi:hypothetical protein